MRVLLVTDILSSFEDQALLFIEQAKDAKEQDLQLNLLSRAMDALSHNQSPTKERGLLWFDIAQLASHYKFRDLAMKGIERFLEVEWNPSKTVNNSTPSSKEKVADKQLLRASAVIRFARAEILIQDRLNPEKQIKSIGSTTVARSKSKQPGTLVVQCRLITWTNEPTVAVGSFVHVISLHCN